MILIIIALLILYWVGDFIYHLGYSDGWERGLMDNINYSKKDLPNFIVDGVCRKGKKTICNLGYACDACSYNKDVKK